MNSEAEAKAAVANKIAPMLSVRNGKQAIEFYKEAFGAQELLHIENDDGHVVANLSIHGAEFWVADESPDHQNFSPESLGGTTVRLVLVVADPDATYAQAVKAGARAVSEMANHDYGWRDGRVADPFGHHWEIGKPL